LYYLPVRLRKDGLAGNNEAGKAVMANLESQIEVKWF
jgi:hypothetical protein